MPEKVNVAEIFARVLETSGVSADLPLGAWDVAVKAAFAGEKKSFGVDTPAVTFKVSLVAPVSGAEVSALALREHSPLYYDIFITKWPDLSRAMDTLAGFGLVGSEAVEEVGLAYLSGGEFLKAINKELSAVKEMSAPGLANLAERRYFSKKEGREVRSVEITKLTAAE